MPELPEVETIRRSLLPHLIGRTVVRATLVRRDILIAPGDPPGGFSRQRARAGPVNESGRIRSARCCPVRLKPGDLLQGAAVVDILRRGKQLAIIARPGADSAAEQLRALVIQLGMTGHVQCLNSDQPEPPLHVHARWRLSDGRTFIFHDPRRFGSVRIFRSIDDLHAHWALLGPDALSISANALTEALAGADRPIKAALLDQTILAGVGNIYADESLFLAHIHPSRRARLLRPAETEQLADAIRQVLVEAIRAGGSTLRDYADANGSPGSYQSSHLVYGRGGLACSRCQGTLAAALLAQRTTIWCPSCQPLRPLRIVPTAPRQVRPSLSTSRADRRRASAACV